MVVRGGEGVGYKYGTEGNASFNAVMLWDLINHNDVSTSTIRNMTDEWNEDHLDKRYRR